jgi:hypothetical protein
MIAASSCALFAGQPDATYTSGTATVRSGDEPARMFDLVEGTYYRNPQDQDGLVGARAFFQADDGWTLYLERFGPTGVGRNEVFLSWSEGPQAERYWNAIGTPESCTNELSDDFGRSFAGSISCEDVPVTSSDASTDGGTVDFTVDFEARP